MKTYIVLIAALAAPVAFAQQPSKPVAAPAAAPAAQAGPDAMFDTWDKNHDGSISKDEFRVGFVQVREAMTMQRLRMEFERRDTNRDDKLQASEYAQMAIVQRAGKNAPPMSAFDKDKNQSLDFPEYLDALMTIAKSQPAPVATPKK